MTAPKIALVTAVRDEEANLPRLVASVMSQTVVPLRWTIVDTGSSDGTVAIARAAAARCDWIELLEVTAPARERGAPIVRAIEAAADGLRGLEPALFVNLDADVSFEPTFLAELSAAFAADPALGIASGTCYELTRGEWRERFVTGSSAWGAARAWRWECFAAVRPLEPRFGWDGIDETRAQARGWTTRTLRDLPFHHHRPEGASDGAWRSYACQGRTAHFMGYRVSYLALRSLHHCRRNPAALAMLGSYAARALMRSPRLDDRRARAYLREQQRLRNLAARGREALGG